MPVKVPGAGLSAEAGAVYKGTVRVLKLGTEEK